MSVLSVQNLKFKYPQRSTYAVDDVSFQIEKGSYTAIIGLNGSGKSSLARLICGLEVPEQGSITIEKNLKIGMVFQSPKDQLVSSIVSRDTAFGPQNLGISAGEVELRTIECLNIVEMLHKAASSTASLSLGQTQKVALSGILAINPEILILDEAMSMLDPASRHDIFEFLRYWHQCGNTIIHITHDLEAVNEAENVIGMENGKIFFYGRRQTFLEDSRNVYRIEGDPLPVKEKSALQKKVDEWAAKNQLNDYVSLEAENLSFAYDKKNSIKNINFKLYKGTVTALTGASGAGKSTLLEVLAGLLRAEGSLFCDGRPVLAQQNAAAALFETFAADDVAFGPRNLGIKGKNLKEIVKNSMDYAAIPFEIFAERQTFGLSGGEQRRLSIAGILAMNSNIVLFDEPTAGLDSKSRDAVIRMFGKLADEGKTVLFSTHQRDEAASADREIVVERGEIVKDSLKEPDNFQKSERLCVQPAYEAISLLDGLRSANVSVSGSNKSKKSPVEKLPAFLRILIFLLIFAASLIVRPVVLCAAVVLIASLYGILCGISFKGLVKACLKILPFLLFFSILQLMFHPALENETRFTTWRWLTITPSKLWFCLATILRTDAALICISGFFVSTPEHDLIDGLKILLKPLALCKIPVHYLILIIEVIFRFIPLLIEEAAAIIKTQIIRGGLGKQNKKTGKIKALIPLVVPLIIQTIKRSEALADAITMRYFK